MNVDGTRIMIFGATGFIGSRLATVLSEQGAMVIGASRHRPTSDLLSGHAAAPWTWVSCDAADASAVDALFAEHRPQIIYHLTSDSRGGRELELVRPSVTNDLVAGVNVLVAAARSCERLVLAASLEEPDGDAVDATPVSPYAAAKYAIGCYARMFTQLYDLPAVMVRPMMGYGPRQNENKLVPSTILSLLANKSAMVQNPGRSADWIYVDDIVRGLVNAGRASGDAHGNTYDLGTGSMVTNGELVTMIARQLGREHLVRFGSGGSRGTEMIRRADTDTTRDALDWTSDVSLEEGLQRTIDWFRQTAPR